MKQFLARLPSSNRPRCLRTKSFLINYGYFDNDGDGLVHLTDMSLMQPFEIAIVTPYIAQIKLSEKPIMELSRPPEWETLRLNEIHISTVKNDLSKGRSAKSSAKNHRFRDYLQTLCLEPTEIFTPVDNTEVESSSLKETNKKNP